MDTKLNRFILRVCFWVPKLVYLNILWAIHALPLITLVPSTRALIRSILHFQTNTETTGIRAVFTVYFKENTYFSRKKEWLYSLYFWLILIDYWVLNPETFIGASIRIALLLFCLLSSFILVYQTLLSHNQDRSISFFFAFFSFLRNPWIALGHVVLTVSGFLLLLSFSPALLIFSGMSILLFFNMQYLQALPKKHLFSFEK